MLKINLEFQKGILFVRLNGNLNRVTSKKLNNYLLPVIMKHGIKYLVYNVSKINSIDNIGKKSLIKGMNAIIRNKGLFCVCDIPFNLTNIFENLPIIKLQNEEEALKAIAL